MGTTDVSLGLMLLDCLDRVGVDFAVLHKVEALVPGGETSDLDVAVAGDVWQVTRRLLEEEDSHGLRLAMLFEYDFNSLSSFWLTESGEDGVQLDLLADPRGRGRIGLLTDAALAAKTRDEGWPPHLRGGVEAVYTVSKRILKRDQYRALVAIEALETAEGANAEAELRRLLSPRMRRRALRALHKRRVAARGARWDLWRPRVSLFGLRRLRTATGAVVAVTGDPLLVRRIADRLSLILPRVEVRRSTPSGIRAWWLTRAPRLVIVATGEAGSDVTSVQIGRSVVEELSTRTRRRIESRVRGHARGA